MVPRYSWINEKTGVISDSSAALTRVIGEFRTTVTADFVGRRFKLRLNDDFLSPDTGRKIMFNQLQRVTDEKEILKYFKLLISSGFKF